LALSPQKRHAQGAVSLKILFARRQPEEEDGRHGDGVTEKKSGQKPPAERISSAALPGAFFYIRRWANSPGAQGDKQFSQ
jgi:hypothetical protein